ncbi:hypothetical protein P5673_003682, partial [Acropora cervicornis]
MHFHRNFSFYSCALTSKVCFFVCTFIKTFPFTGLHLHQNVCLNSCSPRSKFLLLPVCAYIKSFFCVWAFIKRFALTRVRLHQKVCFLCMHFHRNFSFYSCALTSKVCFF